MSRDLRKLCEEERIKQISPLREGHRERFLERLNREMPRQKKPYRPILKSVASILILVSVGTLIWNLGKNNSANIPITTGTDSTKESLKQSISLGDLSPDLKNVENYYVTNINLELAQLQVSKENRELVNSYMSHLSDLNDEYQKLNNELNQMGPNEQTITALIKNLQLRLQLLLKLKEKLNELKIDKNETFA
jgi:hypothetical protein